MSVHLAQGSKKICWLGADDLHKSISAFLGAGNADMPFSQPCDTKWHSFAYESDGEKLSLWHNGNKCGENHIGG